MHLQVCSECGEDQPAAAFHRSKSYNDGLYGKCKRCCAAALQRRRAAAEGGPVSSVPHSSSRRGGRHQSYEPMFGGGLGSADIGSMLSDATRYGDPITKVTAQQSTSFGSCQAELGCPWSLMQGGIQSQQQYIDGLDGVLHALYPPVLQAMAELVAENARSGNPARTPQELAVALLQGGTPREAVETRLPGLVSTLFGRSGASGVATETAGELHFHCLQLPCWDDARCGRCTLLHCSILHKGVQHLQMGLILCTASSHKPSIHTGGSSDELGDSDDSAHTASRDGRSEQRSGRSGASGMPPLHTRFADTIGASGRPCCMLAGWPERLHRVS
jgi:hypothetical protein